MKKRKLVVVLLALVMTLSALTVSASAASVPGIIPSYSSTHSDTVSGAAIPSIVPQPPAIPNIVLKVKVNGILVPDVNVYQGTDGFFRVNSSQDLKKIFPKELNWAFIGFNPSDGIVLDTYIKLFGYTAEVRNNTLNIRSVSGHSTDVGIIPNLVLNVSVDNILITGVDVYQDVNGNFVVYSYEDVFKIFPPELYYPTVSYQSGQGIILDQYIKQYGYTAEVCNNTLTLHTTTANNTYAVYLNGYYLGMKSIDELPNLEGNKQIIYHENRIYINNDDNYPVEIMLNGKLIYFPDQQPIIIRPGYTMVPIWAISELLGFDVSWVPEYHCAVITKGSDTIHIVPDKTTYLLNGQQHSLDVPAKVINGRTMVPLSFVAEVFDLNITYTNGTVMRVTLD